MSVQTAKGSIAGMVEPPPRFWELFFEVYEALPRQGPGNRVSTAKALALCRDLPVSPAVLDLGCACAYEHTSDGLVCTTGRCAPNHPELQGSPHHNIPTFAQPADRFSG
jgi:hypothetical protein